MAKRKFERILVIRLDNVGDVVMLTPALRALRAAYPAAHITLLCSKAGQQVVPMLPWLDDALVHRASWQDISRSPAAAPVADFALISELRACRFDAAFVFTSFSQSPFPPAYACYLAGIPHRFGESKEFGGAILGVAASPLPDDVHQVDRNLHLLEAAGVPTTGTRMELSIPPAAEDSARALLRSHDVDPTRFVVLAPGASCDARRYDAHRFAEVARLLVERGLRVVVVGSEADVPAAELILGALPRGAGVSLAGRTSIPGLAAVIRAARLVIANNSGPMHIADAFQRPQVVLYSGTEYEEQWRPRHSAAVLLRTPTSCSPCFAFRCPYHMECLDIPPAEVVAAAERLLSNGSDTVHTPPEREVVLP